MVDAMKKVVILGMQLLKSFEKMLPFLNSEDFSDCFCSTF